MTFNTVAVIRHYALSIRESVVAAVELLASASEQQQYAQGAPHAFVPGELIETGHDLLHPKSPAYAEAFTDAELRDLAHLYGLVCEAARIKVETVAELQKQPEWRRVMSVAKDLTAQIGRAV